jgi:molybdenum cofactor cytidylyltransferase
VISGIILAAGGSARLGTPKQLLELDGRPLLQHVVDAAEQGGLDEVIVVLGHEAEHIAAALRLPSTVRMVVNPRFLEGQSTSLRAGVDATDPASTAAVVLLGDQPRLTAPMIRKMVAAFQRDDRPIARAVFDGVPGHPVVLARSEWAMLDSLEGDAGARAFLDASDKVNMVDMGAEPLEDVDTWEQYERVRQTSDAVRPHRRG